MNELGWIEGCCMDGLTDCLRYGWMDGSMNGWMLGWTTWELHCVFCRLKPEDITYYCTVESKSLSPSVRPGLM